MDETTDETIVLRRLLALALGSRAPEIGAQLSPALQRAARATYFLLDVEPNRDTETFVTLTLDRLLRQLNRRTEQQQIELQGRLRGRVIWPATLKARHTQGYDPARYVCREVRREYDTPENQLLRYMVERINECLAAVPEVLRTGRSYIPAALDTGSQARSSDTRLARIERVLNMLRFNARLRDVTLLPRVEEFHILRAETARCEEYASVAQIYRRYASIVLVPSWRGLAAAGQRVLLLPTRVDPAGEPWIRLGASLLRWTR